MTVCNLLPTCSYLAIRTLPLTDGLAKIINILEVALENRQDQTLLLPGPLLLAPSFSGSIPIMRDG
jgi:hypothetical protein